MASRKNRMEKILQIVSAKEIETQGELAAALQEEGFQVTQATVSRDIRALRLVKRRGPSGRQHYAVPETELSEMTDKYIRVMRDGLLTLEQAQNILVVKTVSGMAMAVAAALDALKFPEIVGCIAGDDTVMAAVRSADETAELIAKIHELVRK